MNMNIKAILASTILGALFVGQTAIASESDKGCFCEDFVTHQAESNEQVTIKKVVYQGGTPIVAADVQETIGWRK